MNRLSTITGDHGKELFISLSGRTLTINVDYQSKEIEVDVFQFMKAVNFLLTK
jgi:hypothetical protein